MENKIKIKTPENIKIMRINLVIFAFLHFFYVVAVAAESNTKPVVFGIFVQYWISSWILRTYIFKSGTDATKISLYTWGISVAVFLARVLLGLLIFPLLYAR